jgi:hypothetical protein
MKRYLQPFNLLVGSFVVAFLLITTRELIVRSDTETHPPEDVILELGSNVIKTYDIRLDGHTLYVVEFTSDRGDYCIGAASEARGDLQSVAISCLPQSN